MDNTRLDQLSNKVAEVYKELQQTAHWKEVTPGWVYNYQNLPVRQLSFDDWLQFVFLPNKAQGNKLMDPGNIAPQAINFFGEDVNRGKLLQLLIELDALI